MTKIEQAISATRGEMRHIGLDPEACNAETAHRVLDDLCRNGHELRAWYLSASQAQITGFIKGWSKWLKSCQK